MGFSVGVWMQGVGTLKPDCGEKGTMKFSFIVLPRNKKNVFQKLAAEAVSTLGPYSVILLVFKRITHSLTV